MHIDSPLPTYIAYEVGYYNDSDLINWAIEYLPNSEYFSDDPDLIELMSINHKVVLMTATMEPFDDRLMEPPCDRVNGAM